MGKSRDLRSHGIMVKALEVGQEGEWHHPEAEVHHALFMLELTDVEMLASGREGGQRALCPALGTFSCSSGFDRHNVNKKGNFEALISGC